MTIFVSYCCSSYSSGGIDYCCWCALGIDDDLVAAVVVVGFAASAVAVAAFVCCFRVAPTALASLETREPFKMFESLHLKKIASSPAWAAPPSIDRRTWHNQTRSTQAFR